MTAKVPRRWTGGGGTNKSGQTGGFTNTDSVNNEDRLDT